MGRLTVPGDGLLSVPRIAPVIRQDASQIVAFYRDDNLSAEWRFPAERPWVESGASLDSPFDDETHFVQAFTVNSAAAVGVQLAVDRSEPTLAGETLTRVRVRGKNGWEVIWECSLRVEHGSLDVLRLWMPGTCAGPFDVTPIGKLEIAAPRESNGNIALALRLPRPVQADETIRLELRSPLATPDGQPVAAPRICLLAEGERATTCHCRLAGTAKTWHGPNPASSPANYRRHYKTRQPPPRPTRPSESQATS